MSSSACYQYDGTNVINMTNFGWTSCQGQPGFHDENYSLCCLEGHTCGANGVCNFQNPSSPQSGFYFGGCTDPNFEDPICQPLCNEGGTATDIAFVQFPGTWACCTKTSVLDQDVRNCSEPLLDQAYELGWAPAAFPGTVNEEYTPATSTTVTSSPTSSTTASTNPTSLSSSSTAATSSATTASPSASSGLSTGAKAGIGIGVSLGVLLLAGVGLILFLRRRRHTRAPGDSTHISKEKTLTPEVETSQPTFKKDSSRFSEEHPRHEMSAHRQRAELES